MATASMPPAGPHHFAKCGKVGTNAIARLAVGNDCSDLEIAIRHDSGQMFVFGYLAEANQRNPDGHCRARCLSALTNSAAFCLT